MAMLGGLRAMSGRTAVLVALAAAYYLALNAVLINELVERVRTGSPRPVAPQSINPTATPGPQAAHAACADLPRVEAGVCRIESRIGRASGTFKEERREWRAARDERRAATLAAPARAAQPERAAALR